MFFELQDGEGHVWILLVVDHFTKFWWAEAFKTKEAGPIAEFLFKIFSDGVCVPERWHADNGGEFKNDHIDAVRKMLSAKAHCHDALKEFTMPYSHGMPRNPQCQSFQPQSHDVTRARALHVYYVLI